MNRLIALALILACTSGLAAQATLNIAGTVLENTENLHRVSIDFGSPANMTNITLSISGNNATHGLQASLIDLDQVAAAGTGIDDDSDAGTGTINLSVMSGNFTGVRQFVVAISSFTGSGTVAYTGTLTFVSIPTGATAAGTQVIEKNELPLVKRYFDRAYGGEGEVDSSGNTVVHEFLVDFGPTAQTMTFFARGSADLAGDIQVIEMLANGTGNVLYTLSGVAADWEDATNLTTSSRSGLVRLRFACSEADASFSWNAILPSTVTAVQGTRHTFSGSLAAYQSRLHRFRLDFGPNSTNYTFNGVSATQTGDVEVGIIDLTELVANGSTNGVGSIESPVALTPSRSGVHEFFLLVREDNSAAATYSITVEFMVASAAFTTHGTKLLNDLTDFTSILERAVIADFVMDATGTRTFEFNVNFGSVAQSAALWLQGEGGATGSVALYEVVSGTATLIDTVSWVGDDGDESNDTTFVRSGNVRMRVVVTGNATEDYSFVVFFDDNVTVSLLKKKKDDDSDDGCSTGGNTGMGWLALIGLLASLIAVSRLRAARE